MEAIIMRRRCVAFRLIACLVGVSLALCGCKLFGEPKIVAPLSFQKQMDEIYRIAPNGTPREEAVTRLNKAGITGEYAPHVHPQYEHNPSVYYCQFKDEPNGTRRQMTVALLFNEQNRLYAVTLTDMTDIPVDTTEESPRSGRARLGTTGATSATGFPSRSTIPLPQTAAPTTPAVDPRHPRLGTRTPFGSGDSY